MGQHEGQHCYFTWLQCHKQALNRIDCGLARCQRVGSMKGSQNILRSCQRVELYCANLWAIMYVGHMYVGQATSLAATFKVFTAVYKYCDTSRTPVLRLHHKRYTVRVSISSCSIQTKTSCCNRCLNSTLILCFPYEDSMYAVSAICFGSHVWRPRSDVLALA
jgi:hypothetical protein